MKDPRHARLLRCNPRGEVAAVHAVLGHPHPQVVLWVSHQALQSAHLPCRFIRKQVKRVVATHSVDLSLHCQRSELASVTRSDGATHILSRLSGIIMKLPGAYLLCMHHRIQLGVSEIQHNAPGVI